MKQEACAISGKKYFPTQLIALSMLAEDLQTYILLKHPDLKAESLISYEQLVRMEQDQVKEILAHELGESDDLKRQVLESIRHNEFYTSNANEKIDKSATVGDRVADAVASFGGSWTFIISFFSFIALWMALNIIGLHNKGYDPYPFILLNLILSCLAAIQAPIIMMSQNRQETKDRIRSEHDYKINLKAELEIKLLHKKLDHLMEHHNRHLLEIQRVQTDMLEHLTRQLEDRKK